MEVKKFSRVLLCLACAWMFSGCLSTEYKEYSFRINEDGSGSGTIKFIGIVSEQDGDEDVSAEDFDDLINGYLNGDKFEGENPYYDITSKRLYSDGLDLVGEVTFTFDKADQVGFYRYKNLPSSPYMFYVGNISENITSTNGEWLGRHKEFPLIVWEPGTAEMSFKALMKEDMTDAVSLLTHWEHWKDEN